MNEQDRIQELFSYKILDTSPEKELDELAEIASAICNTPISLLAFLDDRRQWFKAKKGLSFNETPIEDSFCQHSLHNPKEVLVVNDPLNDVRFKDNPMVQGNPHVRFYAGAPLETNQGNVLGTLCIMDDKPRDISENQKNALTLLAKKAMDYLETRKLLIEQGDKIESNASLLKKLTDQAPGVIYQLEVKPDGKVSLPFLSEGLSEIYPSLNPEELKENPQLLFEIVHPDDVALVRKSIKNSFSNLTPYNVEYRITADDGSIYWHWASSNLEKKEDGTIIWYGTIQDVTDKKGYVNALEQFLFDISHVMRRPVATMLGITGVIKRDNLDEDKIKAYAGHIETVSEEMDKYIRGLNETYSLMKSKIGATTKMG